MIPTKDDERTLLRVLQQYTPVPVGYNHQADIPYVRGICSELSISDKRVIFILKKWKKRGWWEYRHSIIAGWLTEKGIEADFISDGVQK